MKSLHAIRSARFVAVSRPVFLPALEDLAGHLKWDTATAGARQLTGFNRDTRSFGAHNSPKHGPSFCEDF